MNRHCYTIEGKAKSWKLNLELSNPGLFLYIEETMVGSSNRQIRQMRRIQGKQEHQNRFFKTLVFQKKKKPKVSKCYQSQDLGTSSFSAITVIFYYNKYYSYKALYDTHIKF